MKKKNEVNIAEAIQYFIREHGMEERILESMAIDGWHDQMGDFMKNYTERIFVKNRVLFIKLNSPALKNELNYGKTKILDYINQFIGKTYLEDVQFL
ncbi:MAG: DciA family protein [Flavobacteriaceae bacterium]|nr:DciA family protein [Flavobacteriaceae bacterium]